MLSHFAFVTSLLFLSAAFKFDGSDDWDLMEDERALEEPLFDTVVRAPAPNSCDGGSALFIYNVGAFQPCRMEERNDGKAVVLRSPTNNLGTCSISFSSEAPGFIRGKILQSNLLGAADSLTFTGVFGDTYTITSANSGDRFILPSTFGSVSYSSLQERLGQPTFKIRAAPRSNIRCQKVVTAPAGSTGRLTLPGFDARNQYNPGTMCQWWITAPVGKQITLKFNAFGVGDAAQMSSGCANSDYIGVDTTGDKTYTTAGQKICGDTLPADIISNANKINVIANGAQGGRGFCLTYHIDA